jgi:hypothetical protein
MLRANSLAVTWFAICTNARALMAVSRFNIIMSTMEIVRDRELEILCLLHPSTVRTREKRLPYS